MNGLKFYNWNRDFFVMNIYELLLLPIRKEETQSNEPLSKIEIKGCVYQKNYK